MLYSLHFRTLILSILSICFFVLVQTLTGHYGHVVSASLDQSSIDGNPTTPSTSLQIFPSLPHTQTLVSGMVPLSLSSPESSEFPDTLSRTITLHNADDSDLHYDSPSFTEPLLEKIRQMVILSNFTAHENVILLAYKLSPDTLVGSLVGWQALQTDESGIAIVAENSYIKEIAPTALVDSGLNFSELYFIAIGELSGEAMIIPQVVEKVDPYLFGYFIHKDSHKGNPLTAQSNLKITATPPTPLPPTSPTPRVTVSQPDQFIRHYYAELNMGDYVVTWPLLSSRFQHEKNKDDFASYINFWRKSIARVEVLTTRFEMIDTRRPNVYVTLQLYQTDQCVRSESHKFGLIPDASGDSWLIDIQEILSSELQCSTATKPAPAEPLTTTLPTPQPTSTPIVKVQNASFTSFSGDLPPDVRQESAFFAGGGGDAGVEAFVVFIDCEIDGWMQQTFGSNDDEIGWMGTNWFLVCGWQPNEQVTITIKLGNGVETQSTIIADEQGRVQFNCFIEEDNPLGTYTFTFQGVNHRITRDMTVTIPPGKQRVLLLLGADVFGFGMETNSYCGSVGLAPVYGFPTKAVVLSTTSTSTWEDCQTEEIRTGNRTLQNKIQRLLFYGFVAHERIRLVAYASQLSNENESTPNFVSWYEIQVDENGRLLLKLENLDLTNILRIAVIGDNSGEKGCYPSWGRCWPENNFSTFTTHTLTPTAVPQTPQPILPDVSQSSTNCTYHTRLEKGGQANVLDNSLGLNLVLESPHYGAQQIGVIQFNEKMVILDGPDCQDNMIWWYVQADDGAIGWTSEGQLGEYWLAPVEPDVVSQPNTESDPVITALHDFYDAINQQDYVQAYRLLSENLKVREGINLESFKQDYAGQINFQLTAISDIDYVDAQQVVFSATLSWEDYGQPKSENKKFCVKYEGNYWKLNGVLPPNSNTCG